MKNIFLIVSFLFFQFITKAQTPDKNENFACVNITTTDDKNVPRKGEIITLRNKKTNKEYSGVSDSTGKLTLYVPKGETYKIFQKTITNIIEFDEINIANGKGKMQLAVHLQLTEIVDSAKHSKHYILENVYFNTGRAVLKPESFTSLNNLVEVMKLKPTMVIEISGHTDDVGDDALNLELSQKRAESVRNYLIKNGIASNRVTAKGYGETQPIADNSTPEGKAKNRRTEVKILKN